jgi:hypothetical protein
MYSIGFLRPAKIAALCMTALCLLSIPAQTETFVSYNGRFHFAYPESWTQLDYITAEFYLTRGDTTRQVDFEGVFCDEQTAVLFRDQYLILTVDTIGGLSTQQTDSVANALVGEFGRPIKEVAQEAFMASSCRDSIVYDRAGSRFAVENEVPGDSSGAKINLLVMKIYEYGIANYYFYSPTSTYARNLPLYRDMVASFSTEPLSTGATAEPVKVADLEAKSGKTRNYPLLFGPPIVVILIILVVRLRKKRQQTTRAEDRKG